MARSAEGWVDVPTRELEVWALLEGVVLQESLTRRRLLTPDEADDLASFLRVAARDVRTVQKAIKPIQ